MKLIGYLSRAFVLLATSCVPLVGVSAVSAAITIQTVPVGNPGNAPDPATGSLYGSLDYAYNIGVYDVTSNQYTAFLNAVAASDPYDLYNSTMAGTTNGSPGIIQGGSSGSYTYSVTAGRGNYPATDVTFWNATRFANWLDNGQPTGPEGPGTTETGAYSLNGVINPPNTSITRNANPTWAVTSENEWYKAAYYDPTLNADSGGYWEYPTQSNTVPSMLQANYGYELGGGDTTPVGFYGDASYYGTYDQAGDVFQWNESIISSSSREVRGGSFDDTVDYLASSDRPYLDPTFVSGALGFRVSEVPEPASLGILALGLSGMLLGRRGVRRYSTLPSARFV